MFLGSGKLLDRLQNVAASFHVKQISIKEVVLTVLVCSGQCLDRLPAHSAVSG